MTSLILDYTLSGNFMDTALEHNFQATKSNLETANDANLDYDMFLGDFILRQGDIDFSTHLQWIPVLHFATYFYVIGRQLHSVKEDTYRFTESEYEVLLRLQGNDVQITANYIDGVMRLKYFELLMASREFLAKVTADLGDKYPDLKANPAFLKRVAMAKNGTTQ